MSGANLRKFILIDETTGNEIQTHLTAEGGYHLGVQTQQDVTADTNNSSVTNLTSGNSYTFTGTGTSTLGVAGLQWSLKTDQNATVYIEESPDNSNWDISYGFDYIESKGGRGETVQATQAYWRIRVVLTGTTDTTYFRLSGILCPIAAPLPSDLSPDGRLKSESTLTGQQNTGRHAWISPTNELATSTRVRLVGTNFDGSTKDPNFWTETVAGSGSVTQGGEITLATGTTANSTASYASVNRARFIVGSALVFIGAFKFKTAGTADNIRRCGAYDADEGFFFQLDGTTFSVGTRKSAADTLVSSGDFNGNLGATFTPLTTVYYKLDIEWTPIGAFYYINGVLLHQILSGHLSDILTLPILFENINDNGSTADIEFDCLGVVIMREGELTTNATYYHLSGNAATHILKYGAGTLQKIMFNNTSGTNITIYDNTAGSGTVIGIITTTSNAIGEWEYNAPFSTGLTLVTTGNSLDATIIYE